MALKVPPRPRSESARISNRRVAPGQGQTAMTWCPQGTLLILILARHKSRRSEHWSTNDHISLQCMAADGRTVLLYSNVLSKATAPCREHAPTFVRHGTRRSPAPTPTPQLMPGSTFTCIRNARRVFRQHGPRTIRTVGRFLRWRCHRRWVAPQLPPQKKKSPDCPRGRKPVSLSVSSRDGRVTGRDRAGSALPSLKPRPLQHLAREQAHGRHACATQPSCGR
jgi:hypothetical protein